MSVVMMMTKDCYFLVKTLVGSNAGKRVTSVFGLIIVVLWVGNVVILIFDQG